jgi:large subunit ribosomal protein L17
MPHNVAHRKLGRVTEHRIALLRNQAAALLRHERIETTMPKAKELRPFVERLITIAKRGVAAGDGNGKALHARRLVLQDIPDKAVVGKLFDTLAPRFAERAGGYTRRMRV